MKITAIKAQVKNPNRVSVYVDEAYSFSLSHTQLLEQKIHSGLELDTQRLAELKRLSDIGKAYERALLFATLRPRSIKEMYDYARRKKWDNVDAKIVIDKLIAKNYVNDQLFAKSWVENRKLTKSVSLRQLRLELKQKGIADEIASKAMATYDDQSPLRELIVKKRRLSRFASDDQKLMQYLARQGFGFDDIKKALAPNED